MTETNSPDNGIKRFRSPPYPGVDLREAIEKATQLYAKAHQNAVGVGVLAESWDFGSVRSSGIWTMAAALLQFGLLEDEGSGEKRKFKITDMAMRIVRDPNPASEKRLSAIRAAALTPKIFKEIWDKFGTQIGTVSDMVVKGWLTIDRHEAGLAPYSDAAADEVIRIYKVTANFAGLAQNTEGPEERWAMDAQVERDLAAEAKPENPWQDQPPVKKTNEDRGETKKDISVLLQGNVLEIKATVDKAGLARLKQILDKYEEILNLL